MCSRSMAPRRCYDERYRLVKRRFVGVEGAPIAGSDGWSEARSRYDDRDAVIDVRAYGVWFGGGRRRFRWCSTVDRTRPCRGREGRAPLPTPRIPSVPEPPGTSPPISGECSTAPRPKSSPDRISPNTCRYEVGSRRRSSLFRAGIWRNSTRCSICARAPSEALG
jgi:hypothetical protein